MNPYTTRRKYWNLLTLEQIGADRFSRAESFHGEPECIRRPGAGPVPVCRVHDGAGAAAAFPAFAVPVAGKSSPAYRIRGRAVRDGKSFSTRRVVAFQERAADIRAVCLVSAGRSGLDASESDAACADPKRLPSGLQAWKQRFANSTRPFLPVPVDFRASGGDLMNNSSLQPYKCLWIRAPQRLPDAPLMHEALFTYVIRLWTA